MPKMLSCPGDSCEYRRCKPSCCGDKAWLWCSSFCKVCRATQQRFQELRIGSHSPSLTTKAQTKLQKLLKAATVFLLAKVAYNTPRGRTSYLKAPRLPYKGLLFLPAPGRACSKVLKALANIASLVKHGVMSATCDGCRNLGHCFVLPSAACLWLLSASQRTAGAVSDTFSLDTCFVKVRGPNLLPLTTSCRTGSLRSSLFCRAEAPPPCPHAIGFAYLLRKAQHHTFFVQMQSAPLTLAFS